MTILKKSYTVISCPDFIVTWAECVLMVTFLNNNATVYLITRVNIYCKKSNEESSSLWLLISQKTYTLLQRHCETNWQPEQQYIYMEWGKQ